ncbi:30S ribosomal protein S20 [Candidatus Peregrinibacteria bacterium]|nr:30S ribosomal protein S20 [Candidatus Peregrinibacteria bacterium]
MPIIKSAIKRMKQNAASRDRNRHYRSHMKSVIKLLLTYVQQGEIEKAKKILPDVISAIDIAAKKRIIHENNAARKKSRIQRAINAGPSKKEEKPVKEKAVKKAAKTKKAKEEKKDE